MAGKERTKLDIIRLKREDEPKPAAPVRRSPFVRKLVIRLLSGLNEHLRREMRHRGDLSSMFIEAVDFTTETRLPTTTVTLPPQLHARIKAAAKARSASMNEMVNTAVAHWLAGKNIIRLA